MPLSDRTSCSRAGPSRTGCRCGCTSGTGAIAGARALRTRSPATPGSRPAGSTCRSTGSRATTRMRPAPMRTTMTAMVRSLWAQGVTGSCVTICTESPARMLAGIRAVAAACEADPLDAATVIGIHVEGPHIASEDGPRGAHPLATSGRRTSRSTGAGRRPPAGGSGSSPSHRSTPGAVAYIRAVVADGVLASVGHTAATGDQIRAAVDAGARWSTHLGNGAHAQIRRHPNYIWDQLAEDRLSAGFIFDGHHLPPEVMQLDGPREGRRAERPRERRALARGPAPGRLPDVRRQRARRSSRRAASSSPGRHTSPAPRSACRCAWQRCPARRP